MKRLLVACAAALLCTIVTFVACKQGEGERCQVDDDCSAGECNKATGTCQSGTGGDLDADVIDAAPMDAPPDALDAMPDA